MREIDVALEGVHCVVVMTIVETVKQIMKQDPTPVFLWFLESRTMPIKICRCSTYPKFIKNPINLQYTYSYSQYCDQKSNIIFVYEASYFKGPTCCQNLTHVHCPTPRRAAVPPFCDAMARLLLLWFALLTSVASQGPCPTDSGVHGYTSIISINNAMKLVLNSIESGGQPKPTYIYTLCPRTVINTDQALTPVLSGAEFICGANGNLSDVCIIEGGANQVLIENSKVTGYSLLNVTFKGITFSGSSQSSVVAGAGSTTTAYFIDCKWFVSHHSCIQ